MLAVLSQVWDSVSGDVGERLLGGIAGPSLLFWLGGLFFFVHSQGTAAADLPTLLDGISGGEAIVLVLIVLLILLGSATLGHALQFATLRFLEGYWPRIVRRPRMALIAARTKRIDRDKARWLKLADNYARHTPEQRWEYRRLDRKLSYVPESSHQVMPTRLGNVIAAAETYGWHRYGLAGVLTWPRLWLVMDDGSRAELRDVRGRLNIAAQCCLWSLLFTIWSVFSPWAVVVAALSFAASYRSAVGVAGGYGELIKAAVDIHHRKLLIATGFLKESEGLTPYDAGRQFTMFVKRNRRPQASQ